SVPLRLDGGAGAIDLYFEDDASFRAASFADALEASTAVAAILGADAALAAALDDDSADHRRSFMDREPARSRGKVWIAVGMVMARTSESSRDVLSRLRAYAYADTENGTLDSVAAALVAGTLEPDAILI
ncbi:MAG: hypothetical protein JWN61_2295, partial [Pseudonocardiales bacterium]|nr:hypothetical protein [Pseudonocardiales bacterium]